MPVDSDFRLYELLKNDSRLLESLARKTRRVARVSILARRDACDWWRMTGSNRRPPACKAGALPAELILRYISLATSYSHRDKVPTTIGAKELNFRVRYGNGCDLFAIATRHIILYTIL